VRPLRETLTVLLFLAVLVRLATRIRRASPPMRQTLAPVLGVAIARLALLLAALATRAAAPDSSATRVLAWLAALTLPALAVSFGIGLLRQRMMVADALQGVGQRIRDGLPARLLGPVLADALNDPTLRLIQPAPTMPIEVERGRHVTEVKVAGKVEAIVVHDASLLRQGGLLDTLVTFVRMALENERLTQEVASSLAEVAASRARIQAAADDERRRIERDLHDGAQQRLVALRVKLALAEELVQEDPERGADRLHALGEEVAQTLEDIRSLARGVFPSLLAERGLPEALRAAGLGSTTETRVSTDGVGRYPQDVESAVYFCCLEALQNATKHGSGARLVTVELHDNDGLHFEVIDDGEGFDVEAHAEGAGLTNMRDRIEAVGGSVTVRSAPGGGTVVSGTVPAATPPAARLRPDGAGRASPPPAAR
jgi:signal transduction histidine kinase